MENPTLTTTLLVSCNLNAILLLHQSSGFLHPRKRAAAHQSICLLLKYVNWKWYFQAPSDFLLATIA